MTLTNIGVALAPVLISGSNATVGGTINFSYKIIDLELATAPASVTGIYLSTDSTITQSDYLISTDQVGALAYGILNTRTLSVMVPASLPAGSYYLGVIADYQDLIPESNETPGTLQPGNASPGVAITIQAPANPLPNLDVVLTPTVSATSVLQGSSVNLHFEVDNLGTATAPETTAGVYLSTDSTITTSDVLIDAVFVGSITPGFYRPYDLTVTIPSTMVPGSYYIGVIPDDLNLVTESNETDNPSTGVHLTIVDPRPDFSIGTVSVTSQDAANPVVPGEAITLEATISKVNFGTSGYDAGVYFSTDPTITTSDRLLGTTTVQKYLASSVSYDKLTVELPEDLAAGTDFYIGVILDNSNGVAEANELNNVSAAIHLTASATSGQFTQGADNITFTLSGNTVSALGGDDIVHVTGFNDEVAGGAGNDSLYGGAGSESLLGGGGDDWLEGGAGGDSLSGGAGNDFIVYDASDLVLLGIDGGAGIDTLVITTGGPPIAFDLASHNFERAEARLTDTAGQSWSTQVDTFDAQWHRTKTVGTNDDNTSWQTTYDTSGGIIEADFFYASGAAAQRAYYDHAGQPADHFTNYFNTSGLITSQDGVNDNGTTWHIFFDSQGGIAESALYYANVNHDPMQKSYYDSAGRSWTNYTEYFNTPGLMTSVDGLNDNGTTWHIYFDSQGGIAESALYYANANHDAMQKSYFDSAGRTWSTYTEYFNTPGLLTSVDGINDDGTKWHNDFDAQGLAGSIFFYASGGAAQHTYYDHAAELWSNYTDYFNPVGLLTSRLTTYDDGHTLLVTF